MQHHQIKLNDFKRRLDKYTDEVRRAGETLHILARHGLAGPDPKPSFFVRLAMAYLKSKGVVVTTHYSDTK